MNGAWPFTRELERDRCSSGSIGELLLSDDWLKPTPESFGDAGDMTLLFMLTGGRGAGRLGIMSLAIGRPWPLEGTGGGARGFSKLPVHDQCQQSRREGKQGGKAVLPM